MAYILTGAYELDSVAPRLLRVFVSGFCGSSFSHLLTRIYDLILDTPSRTPALLSPLCDRIYIRGVAGREDMFIPACAWNYDAAFCSLCIKCWEFSANELMRLAASLYTFCWRYAIPRVIPPAPGLGILLTWAVEAISMESTGRPEGEPKASKIAEVGVIKR